MFTHIFKLIWNRKRSNILIILEVAIAFVVVFALIVLAVRNYNLMQVPLGFDYNDRWRIQVSNWSNWDPAVDQPTIEQMLLTLEQQPEIETANLMNSPTFRDWVWTSSYEVDGQLISFMGNKVDDGATESMGMKLIAGRWFGPQDDGQNYQPVIVSERFVDEFYPGQDVIGKNIAGENATSERRIVGVFEEFRQLGEYSRLRPYLFTRLTLSEQNERALSGLEIKLAPGTSVSYEEKLMKLLKGLAPQWDYEITTWESARASMMRKSLLPVIILSIVGVFLIFMVAMGLFGVLWQNVTSRTQELGLRRALGATAGQVHKQIVGELLVVCLLGILLASVVLVQLPLLGVIAELDWPLFLTGLLVSTLFMITLASLCAYYPGKVATKYEPATALHYE